MSISIFAPIEIPIEKVQISCILDILASNPLCAHGYIYTAVSYLSPGFVRIQAMRADMANDLLDTGERISETADTLGAAIGLLIARIGDG